MVYDSVQRLRELIKATGLSQKEFCKRTGIPESTLKNAFSRNTNPSIGMLQKIANEFPDINVEWVLTGARGMFKEDGNAPKTAAPQTKETAEMISMPREVWDILQSKDQQMAEMVASLRTRDQQVSKALALLEEQIKKGEGVGALGHAAPQAAQK